MFTSAEITEIRGLLELLVAGTKPERRMSAARLRHVGLPEVARSGPAEFEALVESGAIRVDDAGGARAKITPHPNPLRVFRVAVGVTGDSVEPSWSAFDERLHWFGKQPQSLASGDHLFVLAVDRWRSAVVGLYEAVSAGAQKLPDSPDPERWPYALGVRPLAAIPPPEAVRVDRQQGPQSGLPERVYDETAVPQLYQAVASSPPPPGPSSLEHRVQEVEPQDVVDDLIVAVRELGREARQPAVIERALAIGEWTDNQLAARAWYTSGSADSSHVRETLRKALMLELSTKKRLIRDYGSSPIRLVDSGRAESIDAPYRSAFEQREPVAERARLADLGALDKATRRHMEMQDALAEHLKERGIKPRSPAPGAPQFDLAFTHNGQTFIAEAKTGVPVSAQQVRLGVGQVLEYCYVARDAWGDVRPLLLLEGQPPEPWEAICLELGIGILVADNLSDSVEAVLD